MNLFLNYEKGHFRLSKSCIANNNANFRIKKQMDKKNEFFYYIEHLKTNKKLNENENNTSGKNDFLWNFIYINQNNYVIKNNNNCFIKVRNKRINCENITFEQASIFKIIKIYEELKLDNNTIKLLEKEPIDVLIKYIDLRDPKLKRNGIHQIKKDLDNEELKYSIRSILKNIPWIRKIFILMPNEKVRFFKDYDSIKEKIQYVKDKDLLGYDSSNSHAFQFRFWKMKQFGISDNFIIMDDDCFIGTPLKKSDFFYADNNKVFPLIINNQFEFISERYAKEKYNFYKKKVYKTKKEQTADIYFLTKFAAYIDLIKIFNKSIIVPHHTHNAIPANIKEIKETYDLIQKSEFKSYTLDSLYRHKYSIQFQTFLTSYSFIKYNKKVRYISSKYISIKKSFLANYNYSLFCINTGASDVHNINSSKIKMIMEHLFPVPTIYEKNNYSLSDNILELGQKPLKKIIKYFSYSSINNLIKKFIKTPVFIKKIFYSNLLNKMNLILIVFFVSIKVILRVTLKN